MKPKLLKEVRHPDITEYTGEIYGVFISDGDSYTDYCRFFPSINFNNKVYLLHIIKDKNGKVVFEFPLSDLIRFRWEHYIAKNRVLVKRKNLRKQYSLITIQEDIQEKIDSTQEEVIRKIIRFNQEYNRENYDQSITDGLPDSLKLL